MPRTILLITQAFPPEPVVGALRAENVARAFRDAGCRVIVLTATVQGEAPGRRTGLDGVEIHTVALGPRYRERMTRLFRRMQTLLTRPAAGAVGAAAGTNGRARPARGLRGLLLSLVWIPDDELRFVWPAYRAARRLLGEQVDLVYTSAPSHSTNLVGLLLRRLHGVRWAAEFRDPWCYPQSAPVTPFVERVNQSLERRSIAAADHLITVTDQTAELYRERLGAAAAKVIVARNGIPVFTERAARVPGGPFRVVYSGSIYGGRDPRAFVRAVAEVAPAAAAAGTPFAVDIFVGEARAAGDVPLETFVAQLGLDDVVRVQDWMPHAEIQRVLRSADLLLLLAQRQPLQVPNKLYEYLGTGVPILAIADEHGETARMLRQAGGHHVVLRDSPEEIAQVLRDAIAQRDLPPAAAPGVLEEWRTERQMQYLVRAIGCDQRRTTAT